jgi:hypothetical protein
MSSVGSVTHWIGLAKAGDSAAAQPLWERYFQRLVGLARHRFGAQPAAGIPARRGAALDRHLEDGGRYSGRDRQKTRLCAPHGAPTFGAQYAHYGVKS